MLAPPTVLSPPIAENYTGLRLPLFSFHAHVSQDALAMAVSKVCRIRLDNRRQHSLWPCLRPVGPDETGKTGSVPVAPAIRCSESVLRASIAAPGQRVH